MGNLEADFNLSGSSKTSGLSRDAAWDHWMSLGPGEASAGTVGEILQLFPVSSDGG